MKAAEPAATVNTPDSDGNLVIQDLEDDEYVITEIETDDGYLLLKKDINVKIISTQDADDVLKRHGSAKVNDDEITMLKDDGFADTRTISSTQHATSTSDAFGEKVENSGRRRPIATTSELKNENGIVPLTVVNSERPKVPLTGEDGMFLIPIIGIVAGAGCLFALKATKKEDA